MRTTGDAGRRGIWLRLALLIGLAALVSTGSHETRAQGTLSAIETDVDQIVRAARPSVVTVFAQRTVKRRKVRESASELRTATRVGSGVAVEDDRILTTASVVVDAEHVFVRTTNGLQVEAQVTGIDPISNLALLHVTDIRLPALHFAAVRSTQEGEWVMAIGTSHLNVGVTQSVGTVSYQHREPRLAMLQLSNPVVPGYSGGAALNARGELIGIVQGELSPVETASGQYDSRSSGTFVLPSEIVRPIYESLKSEGRVRHGYLGVSTRAASVESSTRGADDRVPIGALVENVQAGGPAALAGLKHGDLIVGFDRVRVEFPTQLARWVAASTPRSTVELVWVRDEIAQTAKVTLTQSPDDFPSWARAAAVREDAPGSRIEDLERQIQHLNRQVKRLKNGATESR